MSISFTDPSNPSRQPPSYYPPARPDPNFEEGESELGSQDAEGEDEEVEEGSIRFSVEEAGTGGSQDEVPSPYLDSHRPTPRITLRVNGAESTGKGGQRESGSPESMDLDPPTAPAGHASPSPPALPSPAVGGDDTPPASPLRAFIAPPARVAAASLPIAPAARPQPAQPLSLKRPSLSLPSSSTDPSSAASSSRTVVDPAGRPTGSFGCRLSSEAGPPPHQPVGRLWQTTEPQTTSVPQDGEDVEMGEEEDAEGSEDETVSEYVDDDKLKPKVVLLPAVGPRGKGSIGSSTSGTSSSVPGGVKGKGKRATRGPGKKSKAKGQEQDKENVREGAQGGADGAAEGSGRDVKSDFAYEYVGVSQRKEGRQHMTHDREADGADQTQNQYDPPVHTPPATLHPSFLPASWTWSYVLQPLPTSEHRTAGPVGHVRPWVSLFGISHRRPPPHTSLLTPLRLSPVAQRRTLPFLCRLCFLFHVLRLVVLCPTFGPPPFQPPGSQCPSHILQLLLSLYEPKLTMYLLPTLWPPHNPTHQLVFSPHASPSTPTYPPSVRPTSSSTFATGLRLYTHPHSAPPGLRRSHKRSSLATPTPRRRIRHPYDDQTVTPPSSPPNVVVQIEPDPDTIHPCVILPNYRPRNSFRTSRKYEMSMRQQPLQARMCNAGEKADRRPIDPPPIIQLKVIDADEDEQEAGRTGKKSKRKAGAMSYMHNPYYFLYATLVGSDEAQSELHVIDDGKTRFLTGTPVSSLYYLKDMNHRDAAFFVFPDLGVRKEGQYKLKLTLFEIVDQEVFYCATSYTDTFTVLSAKKFPGMQRATDLSKSFADQGLKIRVRKETKKRASNHPPRNKRRSSITEEEVYHPKRQRPSIDPSYNFTYDPAYPNVRVQDMPPPPLPHQGSHPVVHPPPLHKAMPHQYPPSAPTPSRRPEHSAPSPYSEPLPLRQDPRLPGRSDGEAFAGHPPSHHARPTSSSSSHPSASAARDVAYFHDERERQRHYDIQMAQRQEIDARRQAEIAKAEAEADRSRQFQQNRQHVQQQQRLHQLAVDQAAYGSPRYPPGYGSRGGYTPEESAPYLPERQAPPAGAEHGRFEFEAHEREKRKAWKVKKQERETRHRDGGPGAEGEYPPGYGPDGRPYYPEHQYHGGRDDGSHHPRRQQASLLAQYPPSTGTTYRDPYPPPSSAYRDPRDYLSRDGEQRREYLGTDRPRGSTSHSDPYSTPAGPDSHHQPSSRHPSYSSSHRPSQHHLSSVPSFDSHHPRSASASVSARSTPQPVRTPQEPISYPLPARLSVDHNSANHYEPTLRSGLPRMRTDDWADGPPPLALGSADRGGEADKGREGLTLPSIAKLTTPGASRQGTPSTPATAVTPGRDHRLGLGHLVD